MLLTEKPVFCKKENLNFIFYEGDNYGDCKL